MGKVFTVPGPALFYGLMWARSGLFPVRLLRDLSAFTFLPRRDGWCPLAAIERSRTSSGITRSALFNLPHGVHLPAVLVVMGKMKFSCLKKNVTFPSIFMIILSICHHVNVLLEWLVMKDWQCGHLYTIDGLNGFFILQHFRVKHSHLDFFIYWYLLHPLCTPYNNLHIVGHTRTCFFTFHSNISTCAFDMCLFHYSFSCVVSLWEFPPGDKWNVSFSLSVCCIFTVNHTDSH